MTTLQLGRPATLTLSDHTLHALFRLGLSPQKSTPHSKLASSITGLRSEHLQPALDRGWITGTRNRSSSPKTQSETHYRLTETGEALLRTLVQFAQSQL